MTRIIAGAARGRRLAVPPSGTRPTSDRAREALFNSVTAEREVAGARVLDLYAGSGAVGLEALSRGADAAVLVESSRAAVAVLRSNVAALQFAGAVVVADEVRRWLRAPTGGPFDVVFADPPYALAAVELQEVLTELARADQLVAGALVIVERSARDAPWQWPGECITGVREKRYGEAVLWYGRAR